MTADKLLNDIIQFCQQNANETIVKNKIFKKVKNNLNLMRKINNLLRDSLGFKRESD